MAVIDKTTYETVATALAAAIAQNETYTELASDAIIVDGDIEVIVDCIKPFYEAETSTAINNAVRALQKHVITRNTGSHTTVQSWLLSADDGGVLDCLPGAFIDASAAVGYTLTGIGRCGIGSCECGS